MAEEALSGLKVVELANLISGPYLGRVLAGFGAEVIKVEVPPGGDEARTLGPFPGDVPHSERSGMFLYLNVNKLGVTLNPTSAAGRKLLLELIKGADVFVENYPPRTIEEWGLSYPKLREVNPRLVMASLTPFGQTGPYRDYKSSPLVIACLGGSAYETPPAGSVGEENLEKMPPLKPWGWGYSFSCAHNAAWGVMATLFHREFTGQGQHVDATELESAAATLRSNVPEFSYQNPPWSPLSQPPGWSKYKRSIVGTNNIFPSQDGYVDIIATGDNHWQRLKKAMGNPEWAESPVFGDALSRRQPENAYAIYAMVREWTLQHTKDYLYRRIQAELAFCFPVSTPADVVNSEHNQFREVFTECDHPVAGRVKFPGAPLKASATPWRLTRPAPLLGEHNEDIYCGRLGYRKEDLAALRALGAI